MVLLLLTKKGRIKKIIVYKQKLKTEAQKSIEETYWNTESTYLYMVEQWQMEFFFLYSFLYFQYP